VRKRSAGNAAGLNATALGKNTNAAFEASTAVGFAARTTRANQVVLGGTGSSVTVGDIAASTAAQVGATSLVTVDATGTLGRDSTTLGGLTSSIGTINALNATQSGQINTLFDLNTANRRDINKANEGVAMALALDSPSIPEGAKYAVSGGIGYYQRRAAGTAALSARIGNNASVSGGVGIGFDSGEVGARGGFSFAW
jgi:trimeric autotransporter adhesin